MNRGVGCLTVAGVVWAWAVLAAQVRPGAPLPWPGPWRAEPGTGPAVAWHVEGASRGTPAVDATSVYVQSPSGDLAALDRDTGSLRWRQRTSAPGLDTAGSSVRLWNGLVIAGDEDLIAFESRTGAPAWRFTPAGGYGVGHYLGDVGAGLVLAGSPSGRMYGVDVASGRQRWSASLGEAEPATVYEPVARQGMVVAGFNVFTAPVTGGVLAVDAADGSVRWRRTLSARDGSAFTAGWGGGLLVVGDVVVAAGRDGTLWGLSLLDGSIAWAVDGDGGTCATGPGRPDVRPLAGSGRLVIAGSTTGCVTALDLDRREVMWRYTDARLGSTATRLASDDRLVYVPFLSGRLVAVDVRRGTERWRIGDGTREFVWAPALAAGRLYLASRSGSFAYSP